MTPISLTAYARRRGVSPVAVSKAVARGRLHDSVVRDERGDPKIADPELADLEWERNTRQRADHPVHPVQPSSRPAVQESRLPGPPDPPRPEAMPGAEATSPPPARRGARVELPEGVPPYLVSQAVRAHAAARREIAAADREELELARDRGQMVDAAELKADFAAHISAAKSRLLGLPSSIAQEMPDLADRIVPIVDRVVREALEELAADGRSE